MDKEIEVFSKLLEKNFANQVIDEFVLVKIEKEYPIGLEPANMIIEDYYSLLESCFTIWDISSRLIIQNKKTLTAHSKYILRLRLLCCRFLYFIFKKEKDNAVQKGRDNKKEREKWRQLEEQENALVGLYLSQVIESNVDLPQPFKDDEVALETLKMFVRCAQNCYEAEDDAKLNECLGFLKLLEEDFSLSEIILNQSQVNIPLYLLANRWLLELYIKEEQEISYQIVTNKFPHLLKIISEHSCQEEKEQIISMILMVICTLMASDSKTGGTRLARYAMDLLQEYNSLIKSLRPDIIDMHKKMIVYASVQRESIEKTEIMQLYENLTACSGDRLTEYLKLLMEAKLRLHPVNEEGMQKDDMNFIMKKLEFVVTQYEVEAEEFCAFVEELCSLYGSLGHQYHSLFLERFLETCLQGAQNAKAKGKKVDSVLIKLIEIWKARLEEKEMLTEGEVASLEGHLQLVLKCVIKDKVSAKKLVTLEKRMLHLGKLLVVREYYGMCYTFLENLVVLIRKDQIQMQKEVCVLQMENCFYLQRKEIKDVFIMYDSIEPNKEDFVYNVCRLKVLLVLSSGDDLESQNAAREIPSYLDSVVESKNFDPKVFFLLVMEFLRNSIGMDGGGKLYNQLVILKEFFIILRKGLERIIDYHLGGSELKDIEGSKEEQNVKSENTFALFKLFCIYLNSFQGLFERVKTLNVNNTEEKANAMDIIGHDTIRNVLEVGFLVLETFRVFCEKYLSAHIRKSENVNFCWLAKKEELNYIDKFYWDISILVGYLNIELSFAQRFIFLSLKVKLMRLILDNLKLFGEFLAQQDKISEIEINTELFLQFALYDVKEIFPEDNTSLSLIKTLLLYVSNTLCMLKGKGPAKAENLSNHNLILKCLELNRALLLHSNTGDKVKSHLQYHCLIEFEYLIITSPESIRMFLEDFCVQIEIESQLFLVFAEIAKKLNKREEYLLCLRGHVKASIKDKSSPSLSLECYVELIENCQTIEEEVCYLRQLLSFLDASLESLKAEHALEDLKQEVEYLCMSSKIKDKQRSEEKKELYAVKDLLLEEIESRYLKFEKL